MSGHKYLSQACMQRKLARCPVEKTGLCQADAPIYPPSFSLQQYVTSPLPYDQGSEGSCTSNAFCANYLISQAISSSVSGGESNEFLPSRAFFYYQEREMESAGGSLSTDDAPVTDSGANVTDGCDYVQTNGVCQESLCPYDDVNNVDLEPSPDCYTDALNHKISSYQNLPIGKQALTHIKASLTANQPVLLAIQVYASFENSTGGIIPMPTPDDPDNPDTLEGGHEILILSYDDSTSTVGVLNSWSSTWGDNGLCHIPYAYIEDETLTMGLTTIIL
jgi:C1A family cysteine protease